MSVEEKSPKKKIIATEENKIELRWLPFDIYHPLLSIPLEWIYAKIEELCEFLLICTVNKFPFI